ncbi:MAG: type II toxin-antitoxin system RelE/ParE family toxin [Nitrososphaerales archaeon]
MTYEAVFLNTFLKQFKKLSEDLQERVKQRVQELAENPYLGLRLRGQLKGFWKDKVGDYRIIYKVEESTRRIVFHDVGLRKKVYD